MAKIPSNFSTFESPFKVLEDLDLNYQTPTSSTRVQKKLLFNSVSSERREKRVTFWHERFVINKHPLQITTLGLKTPPMNESPSIQPLAPIKSRKSINKMDLKPKKLVFKDIEEPEVEIIKYPSKFCVKHDDNIVNTSQYKSKVYRKKQTASDEKENKRELLFIQIESNESNNAKVNLLKTGENNDNGSNIALSLIPSKYSSNNCCFKHFRI